MKVQKEAPFNDPYAQIISPLKWILSLQTTVVSPTSAGQQIGADVREQLVPVDFRFFDLHALQRIEIIGDHEPLIAADAALVSQQVVQHQLSERRGGDVHFIGFELERLCRGKEDVIRQLCLKCRDEDPLKGKDRCNGLCHRGCRLRLLTFCIAVEVQGQYAAVVEKRAQVLEHLHAQQVGGDHAAAETIVNDEIALLLEKSNLVAGIPQDQPAGMIETEVNLGRPRYLGIDFDRIGFNPVPAQELGKLAGAQTDEQGASSLGMKAGERFQDV